MNGTLMVACNCDYGCPCNVNGRPTTGKCEGGWTWVVDTGRYASTTLDGLTFSILADWPGAIHEGGGRAVGYLDERADEAQREVLGRFMRGEAGGPWAIFINTYELDGPHPAPYEVEIAGARSRYKIGESAELQIEPIRNPVTGAEASPPAASRRAPRPQPRPLRQHDVQGGGRSQLRPLGSLRVHGGIRVQQALIAWRRTAGAGGLRPQVPAGRDPAGFSAREASSSSIACRIARSPLFSASTCLRPSRASQ